MEFIGYDNGREDDATRLVVGFYGNGSGSISQRHVVGYSRKLIKIIFIGNTSEYRKFCNGKAIQELKTKPVVDLDRKVVFNNGDKNEPLVLVANYDSLDSLLTDKEVCGVLYDGICADIKTREQEVSGDGLVGSEPTVAIVGKKDVISEIFAYLFPWKDPNSDNSSDNLFCADRYRFAVGRSELCTLVPKKIKQKKTKSDEDTSFC